MECLCVVFVYPSAKYIFYMYINMHAHVCVQEWANVNSLCTFGESLAIGE